VKFGLNTSDVDAAVHEARMAEDEGFDYLGCGEHLFFHGPTPNAFIQLAAAAGATRTIRLVSSIALLPLYPAALAAKMAASLDRVSSGRFEFGVGAGGEYQPEFDAVGVDPRSRFRRLDEGLKIIKLLFAGDRVCFEGEFGSLRNVALDPPPVQRGGPPIWLGGRRDGAIRRDGRYADVWLPYMVDPARMRDGLLQVREAAVKAGRPSQAVSGAVFLWTCADEDGEWARRTGTAFVSATYAQDFSPLADQYLALGTPEEVAHRFHEFAAAGVSTILIQIAAEPAERRRVIQTIAKAVLPRFRDDTVPA
jgi:alkanesulfonate monooxygenase SsuD/methylene tetrahydromethanopterin reductase-like flavin-dependent oxidoreductase (luciferase family)